MFSHSLFDLATPDRQAWIKRQQSSAALLSELNLSNPSWQQDRWVNKPAPPKTTPAWQWLKAIFAQVQMHAQLRKAHMSEEDATACISLLTAELKSQHEKLRLAKADQFRLTDLINSRLP